MRKEKDGWVLAVGLGVLGIGCASVPQIEADAGELSFGFGGTWDSSSSPGLPGEDAGPGGASSVALGDCSQRKDEPDVEFVDSNCDGMDGDAARAIFVSPLGDDDAPGTKRKPLASIARALQAAKAKNNDIYLCSGVYEENVQLVGRGARLYGGYECRDDWRRGSSFAVIAPKSGLPLSVVDAGDQKVVLQNIALRAVDATESGATSVGARFVRSKRVSFDHGEVKAGRGAAAAAAQPARSYASAAEAGMPGASSPSTQEQLVGSRCWTYPPAAPCSAEICLDPDPVIVPSCAALQRAVPRAWTCTTGTCATQCETDAGKFISVVRSLGGDGGNGFVPKAAGPAHTASASSSAAMTGFTGHPALAGLGRVNSEGEYISDNAGALGTFGGIGRPGAGGAGASATYRAGSHDTEPFLNRIGGAGGSSGKPGCGGFPGNPGLGGGGSVGIIVVDSHVELDRIDFETKGGGRGGAPTSGGFGQQGGAGGAGGRSSTLGGGTAGQGGGDGAPGGAGGPGGGGPSIGVLVLGEEPVARALRFALGDGGEGGEPVKGSGVGSGPRGLARDIYVTETAEGEVPAEGESGSELEK